MFTYGIPHPQPRLACQPSQLYSRTVRHVFDCEVAIENSGRVSKSVHVSGQPIPPRLISGKGSLTILSDQLASLSTGPEAKKGVFRG